MRMGMGNHDVSVAQRCFVDFGPQSLDGTSRRSLSCDARSRSSFIRSALLGKRTVRTVRRRRKRRERARLEEHGLARAGGSETAPYGTSERSYKGSGPKVAHHRRPETRAPREGGSGPSGPMTRAVRCARCVFRLPEHSLV